jgi:AcrR family transcriptional regulator
LRPVRERILEVAEDLFYREGVRAVGVDTIIARSGVAKMSLYRNFPSKDALVVAYLQVRSERFWRWWDGVTRPREGDPREQVRALFASQVTRVNRPDFRGCPFVNVATEFPAPDHPAREVVQAHRTEVHSRFEAMAVDMGAARAADLADQLTVLMDGVYASAGAFAAPGSAAAILGAVDVLIEAQLRAAPVQQAPESRPPRRKNSRG